MSVKSSQQNIPADWEMVPLEKLVVKQGMVRGPFGGALKKEFFVQNGYKVYEQKNAIYSRADLGNYFINQAKFEELKRFSVKEGDFIISCSGTIGKIFQIPRHAPEGVINQALLKITTDNNIINDRFFYHQFLFPKFQTAVIDNTQGGAMQNLIGMDIFRKTLMVLPSILEQNRIVAVLETWDRAIEKLKRKIEIKKEIKKGLMQELLTGKKRVSGFKDTWKHIEIGNFCDIKRGGSPRPIEYYMTDDKDGLNWLKIGDVPKGSRYIRKTSGKIKMEGLNKTTVVEDGDFILSNSMSFGRPYIMKTTACIHDGWLALKNISSEVNKDFLYYLLSSNLVQNKFKSISAGSGVLNLKKESVAEVVVQLPSFNEQSLIAKILGVADDEIDATENKLLILAQQKTYLLNNLITGTIRTPESLSVPN